MENIQREEIVVIVLHAWMIFISTYTVSDKPFNQTHQHQRVLLAHDRVCPACFSLCYSATSCYHLVHLHSSSHITHQFPIQRCHVRASLLSCSTYHHKAIFPREHDCCGKGFVCSHLRCYNLEHIRVHQLLLILRHCF